MGRNFAFWIWFTLSAIRPFVIADFNQTSDLYRKLFTDVDFRIHPSVNTSIPTDVYVDFNILALRDFQETDQYFSINAWMEMTWQDEIRSWDPDQYGGVRFVYPGMEATWKPNIIVSNSIEERDVFKDNPAPLSLAWDGTSRWYPGTVFYLSCHMDMTFFPFDRQNCSVRFLAQNYATDVNLIPVRDTANTNNYGFHGEWDLESTSAEPLIITISEISFSRVNFHFIFKRRPAFYLVNVLVPVGMMSLLTPLVFVLPEESGERISFSVTLLLSLSVYMGIVADQLPHSSEPLPITVVYLFLLLLHSGVCVVCSVVHLKWGKCRKKVDQTQNDNIKQGHVQHNSHTPEEDVMKTGVGESKKEMTIRNHLLETKYPSTAFCFTGRRLCSLNTFLLIFFYVTWCAVTVQYFVRILTHNS